MICRFCVLVVFLKEGVATRGRSEGGPQPCAERSPRVAGRAAAALRELAQQTCCIVNDNTLDTDPIEPANSQTPIL